MTRTSDSIRVSRRIQAKRAKVFEAWTRPEKMGWFCPEDMKIVSANSDVRVGGKYRASMQGADGRVYTCFGTYKEIVPDEKVSFTHSWEGENPVETLVVVRLEDRDGGTEVTVTQEGFAEPDEAKGHEGGWTSTLAHLAKQFPTQGAKER